MSFKNFVHPSSFCVYTMEENCNSPVSNETSNYDSLLLTHPYVQQHMVQKRSWYLINEKVTESELKQHQSLSLSCTYTMNLCSKNTFYGFR